MVGRYLLDTTIASAVLEQGVDLESRRASGIRGLVDRGAREHNLKNIGLEIHRNRLVVVTGVSGPGKSSLAFDALLVED